MNWGQGTFASKVTIDRDGNVTREVDGGLADGGAQDAGGGDHRSAPERAALRLAAEHHEGEEEADRREDSAADYGVDPSPRLKVLEDDRAGGAQGRRESRVVRTGRQAQERSGVI